MILYEEGYWSLSFAFQIHGSVIPRALAWAVPGGIAAAALHVCFERFAQEWMSDLGDGVFAGFAAMLGFLIVIRTQKAYSRWWEAGTLLQQLRGEWFNAISNLLAFSNPAEEKKDEVVKFQNQMVRLFSLLYGSAILQVSLMRNNCLEYIDIEDFDKEAMSFLLLTHDSCELVLQWIQRLILEVNQSDVIKIAPPILSRIYQQLGNGIVKLNNARKIKEFPVPFPLAQMVTFMLIIHWFATAVVCATSLSSPAMSGVAAFIVIASFWGVNYLAVDLENPYGDGANDLPLVDMQQDMNRSLLSLLHRLAQKVPDYNFTPEKSASMEKTGSLMNLDLHHILASPDYNFTPEKSASMEKTCSLMNLDLHHIVVSQSHMNIDSKSSKSGTTLGVYDKDESEDSVSKDNKFNSEKSLPEKAAAASMEMVPNLGTYSQPGKHYIDRADDGVCTGGSAEWGDADDTSYRDSTLDDRAYARMTQVDGNGNHDVEAGLLLPSITESFDVEAGQPTPRLQSLSAHPSQGRQSLDFTTIWTI